MSIIGKMGKILWWSSRDENGIIVDTKGNEYYFDKSVLRLKPNQKIEDDLRVKFIQDKSVNHCPCARNIEITETGALKMQNRKPELSL